MSYSSGAGAPKNNTLTLVFPYADHQIVTALSVHTQALVQYLAQTHHLTHGETDEALDAFFDSSWAKTAKAEVA